MQIWKKHWLKILPLLLFAPAVVTIVTFLLGSKHLAVQILFDVSVLIDAGTIVAFNSAMLPMTPLARRREGIVSWGVWRKQPGDSSLEISVLSQIRTGLHTDQNVFLFAGFILVVSLTEFSFGMLQALVLALGIFLALFIRVYPYSKS